MRADLRADCSRCVALCCVAPAFAASADFAIDKPAGRPCPNLDAAFGCSIHRRLRPSGFPGCVVFDCLGAGQRVAQQTFAGRDWRSEPAIAPQMFAAFAAAAAELESLTGAPADVLASVDADARRAAVNPLLVRASELARAPG